MTCFVEVFPSVEIPTSIEHSLAFPSLTAGIVFPRKSRRLITPGERKNRPGRAPEREAERVVARTPSHRAHLSEELDRSAGRRCSLLSRAPREHKCFFCTAREGSRCALARVHLLRNRAFVLELGLRRLRVIFKRYV